MNTKWLKVGAAVAAGSFVLLRMWDGELPLLGQVRLDQRLTNLRNGKGFRRDNESPREQPAAAAPASSNPLSTKEKQDIRNARWAQTRWDEMSVDQRRRNPEYNPTDALFEMPQGK